MRILRILPLALLVLCFTTGCGPDFGDKIYDWIERNTRSYSEQLTRADLKVRWMNQFTEHYRVIGVFQKDIGARLSIEYTNISQAMQYQGSDLESALIQYDRSRMINDRLIEIKQKLDQCDYYFISLDSIGSIRQFNDAGLRAIGKETLLRSFFEIGDQAEKINKMRYEKLFNLKFTLVINENGDVDQEIGHAESGGKSYSGNNMGESIEKFFADLFITAPFVALMNEDKIEKQKKRVFEALDRFDELCLTQMEQYAISSEYLEQAKAVYADHHDLCDSIHKQQLQAWQRLYDMNEGIRLNAVQKLAPYKEQLAEQEFRGQDEIRRILDEEERLQIRQETITMIQVLNQKKREVSQQTDTLARIRLSEVFYQSVQEGKYILSVLHEQQKYLSIYDFIEQYQLRLARMEEDALEMLHNLEISEP